MLVKIGDTIHDSRRELITVKFEGDERKTIEELPVMHDILSVFPAGTQEATVEMHRACFLKPGSKGSTPSDKPA